MILSESDDPNSAVSFSVCFDGTKVPQTLQLSLALKAIIGAVSSREMVDISEESDESVKAILVDNSIKKAKETNVIVVSIQKPSA